MLGWSGDFVLKNLHWKSANWPKIIKNYSKQKFYLQLQILSPLFVSRVKSAQKLNGVTRCANFLLSKKCSSWENWRLVKGQISKDFFSSRNLRVWSSYLYKQLVSSRMLSSAFLGSSRRSWLEGEIYNFKLGKWELQGTPIRVWDAIFKNIRHKAWPNHLNNSLVFRECTLWNCYQHCNTLNPGSVCTGCYERGLNKGLEVEILQVRVILATASPAVMSGHVFGHVVLFSLNLGSGVQEISCTALIILFEA